VTPKRRPGCGVETSIDLGEMLERVGMLEGRR
jgi:hypothetical protein